MPGRVPRGQSRLWSLAGVLAAIACLAACHEPEPAGPSLEEMAGQMIMVGFRGLSVDETHPIHRAIRESHLGGVILSNRDAVTRERPGNVKDRTQLRALTQGLEQAAGDLLIAVDQEGGSVSRLGAAFGLPTPSAARLGTLPVASTRAQARRYAAVLASMGIGLNIAPVVDLALDPESPIVQRGRSFGASADQVVARARVFVEAHRRSGVLTTLKHFPGLGGTATDSHRAMPDATAHWTRAELLPYSRLMESGHVDAIMVAHVIVGQLDPELPASLSPRVVQGLLRDQMGYQGVVISDAFEMTAVHDRYSRREMIRLAVLAGVDILLFGNNQRYEPNIGPKAAGILVGLVRAGALPRSRIEESHARIRALKAQRGSGER